MRFFLQPRVVGALLGWALVPDLLAVDAASDPVNEPLLTVRASDRITLHARSAYMTFSETIVVTPAAVKNDRLRPGAVSLVHLLFAPLWLKDGNYLGPAFPVLRPQLTPSAGRVQRFALVRPDGEIVRKVDEMTLDCRYVLTLEFGHMLPEKFTVTIMMSSQTGLNPGAELMYTPSNDGHAFRSGPPESFETFVHIIADPVLEPWTVVKGDRVVPRAESFPSVILEREVGHTIRFGTKAE